MEVFDGSELEAGLEYAVSFCGFDWHKREMLEWIDKINTEKPWKKKEEVLTGWVAGAMGIIYLINLMRIEYGINRNKLYKVICNTSTFSPNPQIGRAHV